MISISLVIPFYGVEKYIRACLESLYRQDIPESEYEIICINDCSPDNSESIVKDIQKQHSNLRLICHETNKKLGAARNTGLGEARGKYVWFIDSDDFIKDNCLRTIIECCEINSLDILHWSIIDNLGKYLKKIKDTDVVTGIYDLTNGSKDMTFPWNRVYNRDFLIRNKLWFNDLWGGDVIHTIQCLNVAKRTKGLSDCFYFYRVDNMTSDMRSPNTANKTISFSYTLGKALQETTPQLSEEIHPLMEECVEWRINQSLKPILKLPFKEKMAFYKSMSEQKELRRFALSYANRKLRLVLSYPLLVCFLHPIFMMLKSR